MSASRRLTFSLDISSQLDFTLKGQKEKTGLILSPAAAFSFSEKGNVDLDQHNICAAYISFLFFFFCVSLSSF